MTTKDKNKHTKKKKILPNEITFMLKTQIPGLQEIEYMPYMTIPREKNRHIYFDPLIKLSEEIINKVPEDLRIKQFFDANLFKSLVNSHASTRSDSIGKAMYDGYVEHNISIMLKLLFNQNEHIYINKKQYTIVDNDCDNNSWRIGVKSKKISDFDTKRATGPYANMVIYEEIERGNQQLKRLKDDEAYGPNYTGEKNPFVEKDADNEDGEEDKTNSEDRKEFEKDVEKEELTIDDVTGETEPDNLPQTEYKEQKQITNGDNMLALPYDENLTPQPEDEDEADETVKEETKNRVEKITKMIDKPDQLQIEDDTNKANKQQLLQDDLNKSTEQLQIENSSKKSDDGNDSISEVTHISSEQPSENQEQQQTEAQSIEPTFKVDRQNTNFIKNFFKQKSYFNIIDTLDKNLDTRQNYNKSKYDANVNSIKVIINDGGGNCFFIAVAQGINYYNHMNTNTTDKINVNGFDGTDEQSITQLNIRKITYEYIFDTNIKNKSEEQVKEYIKNSASFFRDELNKKFSGAIKGEENIDITRYTDTLKNIYITNQNYLVTYDIDDNGNPTSFYKKGETVYNNPFRLVTDTEELKDYILSDKYWGDSTAIVAVKNKLGLVVAPLEIEKKNDLLGHSVISKIRLLNNYFSDEDDPKWNKYMFLFYEGSHFELIQFPYMVKKKEGNGVLERHASIFNRDSQKQNADDVSPPPYIILILFASLYVNLGQGGKSNFGLLKTNDIFNNLCKSMNKIKEKYYEINSNKSMETVDRKVRLKHAQIPKPEKEKEIGQFMTNVKKYFPNIEHGLLSNDCHSTLPDDEKIKIIKSESKQKKKGGGENDLIKSNYIRPSEYQQPYPPQYSPHYPSQYPSQYRTQYQQPYPPQYPLQYHQQGNVKYISHESYNQLSYYIDVVLVLTPGESIDPAKASQLDCDNKRMKVSRSFNKLIGNNAPLQPDYDLIAKKNVDDNKNTTVKKGGRHTKNKKGKTTRKKRKSKRKKV